MDKEFTEEDFNDAIKRFSVIRKTWFDIQAFEAWMAHQSPEVRAEIEDGCRKWIKQNFNIENYDN